MGRNPTNVTSATTQPLRYVIWETIWGHTVERSLTVVTNAIQPSRTQTHWKTTREHTLGKNQISVTSVNQPFLMQLHWGVTQKLTLEKNRLNALPATTFLLKQAACGLTWRSTIWMLRFKILFNQCILVILWNKIIFFVQTTALWAQMLFLFFLSIMIWTLNRERITLLIKALIFRRLWIFSNDFHQVLELNTMYEYGQEKKAKVIPKGLEIANNDII